MKHLYILLITLVIPMYAMSQSTTITGVVLDSATNKPLKNVTIGINGKGFSFTDAGGNFIINRDINDTIKLSFSLIGYKERYLIVVGNRSNLQVKLSGSKHTAVTKEEPETIKLLFAPFRMRLSLDVNIYGASFNQFNSLLETYNTDFMSGTQTLAVIEIGAEYKRYYLGLSIGANWRKDSLNREKDVQFNTTQYGLAFEYKFIDNKIFFVAPRVAVKLLHYRLINSDATHTIDLETYLKDKELDLRFNQFVGYAGFNIGFKIPVAANDLLYLGAYGGYQIKLYKTPMIYSMDNYLRSDKEINFENYILGMYMAVSF